MVLAEEFAKILDDFGISDKVFNLTNYGVSIYLIPLQMLAVTCNNATLNDTMTLELKRRVNFAGQATWVWCFLHIGNLVGKTMVRAFDVPKDSVGRDNDLQYLGVEELDMEDWQMMGEDGEEPTNGEVEDWVDEIPLLSQVECRDLENQVRPVRIVLTKVSLIDGLTFGQVSSAMTSNSIRYGS